MTTSHNRKINKVVARVWPVLVPYQNHIFEGILAKKHKKSNYFFEVLDCSSFVNLFLLNVKVQLDHSKFVPQAIGELKSSAKKVGELAS